MYSFRLGGRRSAPIVRAGMASLLACIVLASALPGGVSAHEPYEPPIGPNDPIATPAPGMPTCSDKSWATPTVKIHTSGFTGNKTDMVTAIQDVNAQIANVGGSTARVDKTLQVTTPYHETPYNDVTPTIHVGFGALVHPTIASTWPGYSCERFITVDTNTNWAYGTPEDSGEAYYMAGLKDPAKNVYFRISYQHELLHAFQIYTTPNNATKDNHPDDVYSFLNYGERPWANVPADSMIRPLPYDVRKLRQLFPGSGSRTEVAVLNTWFDKSTTAADGSGATAQAKLCKPSAGGIPDVDNMFAEYCGDQKPPSTLLCADGMIEVQYAIANYSTEDVDVTTHLWFSKDADWDPGDSESPTSWHYHVGAAYAQPKAESYQVPTLPSLPGFNTFVIIRVTATTASGVTVKDSIPLRGTVSADPSCFKLSGSFMP